MKTSTRETGPSDIGIAQLPEELREKARLIIGTLDMLDLPHHQYRVVGSAALLLYGVLLDPGRPNDIDLHVSKKLKKQLVDRGETPSGYPVFRGEQSGFSEALHTIAGSSPLGMPIDYVYRGGLGWRTRRVGRAPFIEMDGHCIITLENAVAELRRLQTGVSGFDKKTSDDYRAALVALRGQKS